MARPIWRGSLTFGLVTVPVVLYAWLRRPGLLQLQQSDGPLLLPLLEQLREQAQSAGQETEVCCRQLRDS